MPWSSDSFQAYDVLDVSEFRHMRINHREQFADRGNHVNGIENFWNQAKRHLRRCKGSRGRTSPSTSRNANGASTTAPQTACSQP